MILYDPKLTAVYRDYGILLPISPSRGDKILRFLRESGVFWETFDLPGAACRLEVPEPVISRADVERVHQADFVAALYQGGSGLSAGLIEAWELRDSQGRPNRYAPDQAVKPLEDLFAQVLGQIRGTYLAARLALTGDRPPEPPGRAPGFCYYLGGGMHHGRYDHGTGFCLLNDIVIAARKLQAEHRAERLWIIDVDAHKGCGTAELVQFARARGELGPGQDLGNLSIHMAEGWPLDAETLRNAPPDRAPRIPADVEIPIAPGEEDRYAEALGTGLTELETRFPAPDLAFVVDGADPYEHDGLPSSGLLRLSLAQCMDRDRLVFRYLRDRGIPSAWIMAGGYGDRAWEPPAHFLAALADPSRPNSPADDP
ncbi:MAG: histone deacetylase [Spirochaetaceae bacterium]|jgi:acetoin utilization deacetylase AcuC-like enzyme|nr:histone deacetylase [Spirochaetaceae bacterium]